MNFQATTDISKFLWANSLSECIEMNVIDDRADISLELTNTRVSHRATPSAKNISVWADWLRQSGRTPSELSEIPQWRIAPRPASISRVELHIAVSSHSVGLLL